MACIFCSCLLLMLWLLGLDANSPADEERIRTAYKKLARQWHPDKNPDANATEIFQKVNAAYHRLTQVRASVYVCVDTATDA